jgi:hypothetical protein
VQKYYGRTIGWPGLSVSNIQESGVNLLEWGKRRGRIWFSRGPAARQRNAGFGAYRTKCAGLGGGNRHGGSAQKTAAI